MKVLVLGANGMLGHKLVQNLGENFEIYGTVRSKFSDSKLESIFEGERIFENIDVERFETVKKVLLELKPNVVINCIGIIKQLPKSKSVVSTLSINSIFPHLLREETHKNNIRLITVSTDCVFSGRKGNYKETDVPDAEDLYGKSKNLGELEEANCLTLRTSIIGRELETSHSLVEWFLSNKGGQVKGFSKAVYSGFPTIVLTDIIKNLIENYPRLSGLYHVSSEAINKYKLLQLINEAYNLDIRIERDEEFVIDRSLNSEKFRSEIGYNPPDWQVMIERMANDRTPYHQIRKPEKRQLV